MQLGPSLFTASAKVLIGVDACLLFGARDELVVNPNVLMSSFYLQDSKGSASTD
jgi:hypothetical protein